MKRSIQYAELQMPDVVAWHAESEHGAHAGGDGGGGDGDGGGGDGGGDGDGGTKWTETQELRTPNDSSSGLCTRVESTWSSADGAV